MGYKFISDCELKKDPHKIKRGGGNNSICFNLICLSLQIPDIQQILLSSAFLKFQIGIKDEKQGLIEMFEIFHDF